MNQGDDFIVRKGKFDYFFGRVSSTLKNQQRSIQNLQDLRKLGIDEKFGGQSRLLKIFQDGLNAPEVSRKITAYGIVIMRSIEVNGLEYRGAIEISYFYPNTDFSAIPEVVSIIPKIYT